MTNSRPTHYDSFNSFIQKQINAAVRTVLFKTSTTIRQLKNELMSKDRVIEDLMSLIEREKSDHERREMEFPTSPEDPDPVSDPEESPTSQSS